MIIFCKPFVVKICSTMYSKASDLFLEFSKITGSLWFREYF